MRGHLELGRNHVVLTAILGYQISPRTPSDTCGNSQDYWVMYLRYIPAPTRGFGETRLDDAVMLSATSATR
jgi:hypothetical protein